MAPVPSLYLPGIQACQSDRHAGFELRVLAENIPALEICCSEGKMQGSDRRQGLSEFVLETAAGAVFGQVGRIPSVQGSTEHKTRMTSILGTC